MTTNERVARVLGWTSIAQCTCSHEPLRGSTPDGKWQHVPDYTTDDVAAVRDVLPELRRRCAERFGKVAIRIYCDLETDRFAVSCCDVTLCQSAHTFAAALCEALLKLEDEG